MVFSFLFEGSQGPGRYSRLNSNASDPESDTVQSTIDYSDRFDEDDTPLGQRLREKTQILQERKGPRRSRCFLALAFVVLLCLVSILGALRTVTVYLKEADIEYVAQGQDDYQECIDCPLYSALPDHILAFESSLSFSQREMEHWIASGSLPSLQSAHTVSDFSKHARMDGITTWVNGSDPRHKAERKQFAKNMTQIDYPPSSSSRSSPPRFFEKRRTSIVGRLVNLQNDDKRFREQNELLYNLRSARQSLGDNLRTLHVVSTDYWDKKGSVVKGIQDRTFDGRRGQIPQWVNLSSEAVAFAGERVEEDAVELRIHHDWETFAPLVKTREDLTHWKMKRLPSFDSIAAEAVLGVSMPGLSEISFLASDDMFLGQNLSISDFYSPLYGSVLHLDLGHLISPSKDPWSLGEMVGLRWSASLLQDRFGTRLFPYPSHVHKSLSKPLLVESRMMWKEEFDQATLHRFRAKGRLANSHILLSGLIVERHREALLWSFFISKLDLDGNGRLDDNELARAYELMGTNGTSDLVGRMGIRQTTDMGRINDFLTRVSYPKPLASKYSFSSLDGFPFVWPLHSFTEATGLRLRDGPQRYLAGPYKDDKRSNRFQNNICEVSMNVCWPKDFLSNVKSRNTSEIFTRFAFQEPGCGDCLIVHLTNQATSHGLDSFLPSNNLSFPEENSTEANRIPSVVPAHLPLGKDWKRIDFSLSSVASQNHPGWNRRQFSVNLLQRYNYVIADSPASFDQLTSPSSASTIFHKLERGETAFICLNDDIRWNLKKVRSMMQTFLETMWPTSHTRLIFEKQA